MEKSSWCPTSSFAPAASASMILEGALYSTGRSRKIIINMIEVQTLWLPANCHHWHKYYRGNDQSQVMLKVRSMRSNPYLALLKWQRTWEWINHRPSRKSTAIILLKKHSNEMTPNDISIYPWIRSLLDLHQKSFFLQQAIINTETHKWANCIAWETLESSVTEMSYQIPPLKYQRSIQKRQVKECKSQKW